MKTRRQTRFLRIWWNTNAEKLIVEGVVYYSTNWPAGINIDYYYNRLSTRVNEPNMKKVSSPLPQKLHSAEIGIKNGKPVMKFTKNYEFKKHESDHAGWHNGIRQSSKIKHN